MRRRFRGTSVIEPGYDGFSDTGGHDDKVSVTTMQGAFSGEGFQYLALVTEGSHVEGGEFDREVGDTAAFNG